MNKSEKQERGKTVIRFVALFFSSVGVLIFLNVGSRNPGPGGYTEAYSLIFCIAALILFLLLITLIAWKWPIVGGSLYIIASVSGFIIYFIIVQVVGHEAGIKSTVIEFLTDPFSIVLYLQLIAGILYLSISSVYREEGKENQQEPDGE